MRYPRDQKSNKCMNHIIVMDFGTRQKVVTGQKLLSNALNAIILYSTEWGSGKAGAGASPSLLDIIGGKKKKNQILTPPLHNPDPNSLPHHHTQFLLLFNSPSKYSQFRHCYSCISKSGKTSVSLFSHKKMNSYDSLCFYWNTLV